MGSLTRTGTLALAVTLAIIVTSGSMMHGVMAQGTVACLQVAGAQAPFADAAAVVQDVRLMGGNCCQSNYPAPDACTVVASSGNAAISVCGPLGFCPSCADVGTGVNEVLAQCVTQSNEVLGYFNPAGMSNLFYITSTMLPP